MTNKVNLDTDKTATYWSRDGTKQVCPFVSELHYCGSWCPLFAVVYRNGKPTVFIGCGLPGMEYTIEEDAHE